MIKCFDAQSQSTTNASHTIAYGIQRLNKLVVAEQTYSNFYSRKMSNKVLGISALSFDKNVMIKAEARAQASYDLREMRVRIDSINETIYIEYIPEVKIEVFPDVDFFEMDQSVLNRFTSEELNDVKRSAIAEIQKQIDESALRQEAREQLMDNLEDIYLLAKIYGWKVVDDTNYAESLRRRMQF
ncbi:MAG: DUF4230 domain-containing protein [Weeksellaceae bacterium]|nr:DUF4230 domain-containing protein [Weeksellaceae bacterium]